MSRWPIAALSDLGQFYSGGTPAKSIAEYWSGDIPWVSPKDMNGSAHINDSKDHITTVAVQNSTTRIVPKDSILIVARSGILARTLPIGIACRELCFNQDIKALLVDKKKADANYVVWCLKANEPTVLRRGVKFGATVHSLAAGFLENLRIPLPSLEEQRRIVDVLSRAAGIRRLREQALATARATIPALFLEMFGDPAANPKGWPVVKLGDIAAIQGGLQVSKKRDSLPVERPYLRVANVLRDHIDLSEIKRIRLTENEADRTSLVAGDVLVVEGHGNPSEIGRAALWNGSIDYCVHQNHLIRIRCEKTSVLPYFLCGILNSATGRLVLLRSGKTTSGLNTISTSNVRAVPIPLPPLDLQRRFADRVRELRAIIAQQERSLEAAKELERALMARLLE